MPLFCLLQVIFILGFLLMPMGVYAMPNPTLVAINDTYVFRNLLQTGDQLYLVEYRVSYNTTVVTDKPSDTWQMALYDNVTTSLVATRPLNYFNHNVISIYLNATQALSWGGTHMIKVMGSPSVFPLLTEDVNMQTRVLAPGDYKEKTALVGIIVELAKDLQADWKLPLLTTQDRLNIDGAYYFNKAIPNLVLIGPEAFQYAEISAGGTPIPWGINYTQNLPTHTGAQLRGAFTSMGTIFGISGNWSEIWFAGLFYLVVVGVMFPVVKKPELAFIAGFPVLLGFAWLGLGGATIMNWVVAVIFLAALGFGIYFILGHMG